MKRRLLAPLALAATLLVGCGDKPETPAPAPAERNPLAVTAPESLLAEIKLGVVREADIRESLRVPGRIEVDEQRVTRIGSTVTGRITELEAIVGQDVKKGQELARLSSTELSATQLDFLKAFSQKLLAERASQRAQQLLDADVIGLAELQRRQAELSQAEAEVSAARDQLKVLGMSDGSILKLAGTRQVTSISTVVASLSGTVIERNGTLGQVVQPADTIFVVADLSNVWLVADVPEQHAEFVRPGESIEAEVSALPGKRITGQLSFVSATVNPETRTIKVRMDLPNQERLFKPAMLATVLVKGRAQRVTAVPERAVVRGENKDFLFVQTGPDAFVLREVQLGPEAGGLRRV
ncbi:MAG: Cobalt-zinc-cadmium resistance protein CzcB, partial [Deltaproteobacteria bacterium]|nr:Cobalt-zinc-cadmium resistance protein CzcB [Deltaproteobacteria bacterium]